MVKKKVEPKVSNAQYSYYYYCVERESVGKGGGADWDSQEQPRPMLCSPSSPLYAPKCLEEEFSEVHGSISPAWPRFYTYSVGGEAAHVARPVSSKVLRLTRLWTLSRVAVGN